MLLERCKMPEIGARYNISAKELNDLVKSNFTNAISILEKFYWDGSDKPDYFGYVSSSVVPSEWDRGRIFNDRTEIRWEREGNSFHVVWISDDDLISTEWNKEAITHTNGTREILLWGERDEDNADKWYEKQIPRFLEYPVKTNGQRAYIQVQEYSIKDNLTIYRFKGVVEK
jgi:hypothetical protein